MKTIEVSFSLERTCHIHIEENDNIEDCLRDILAEDLSIIFDGPINIKVVKDGKGKVMKNERSKKD